MQKLTPWLFLAAAVGLLLVFTYWPAVNLFYYSVTDWDGIDLQKNFVGLDNYAQVFTDPRITGSLKVPRASAPTATGPLRSTSSSPVKRHKVSADPL